MKKFVLFILASLLALAFAGCSSFLNHSFWVEIGPGCGKSDYAMGGCYNASGDLHQNKRPELALERYQKACDLGYMMGCYNSGLIYKDKKSLQNKAKTNLTKACKSGFLGACNSASSLLKSNAEKKDLFKAACNSSKDTRICDEYYAKYTTTDEYKAYLSKKCDNYSYACIELGGLYESKNNLSLAKTYYKKACDRGFCSDLRRIDPKFDAQERERERREAEMERRETEQRMTARLGVGKNCQSDADKISGCYALEEIKLGHDSFGEIVYKNGAIIKLANKNSICNVIRNDNEWFMMTCSGAKSYSLKLDKFTGQVTKISTSLDGLL